MRKIKTIKDWVGRIGELAGVAIAIAVTLGFMFMILAFLIFGLGPIQSIGASKGIHTGYVIAVEYDSNVIWPSNLVYFSTNPIVRTNEEKYCVNDETVKTKLEEASMTQKKISVFFKNDYYLWKKECNGGMSIIYDIK